MKRSLLAACATAVLAAGLLSTAGPAAGATQPVKPKAPGAQTRPARPATPRPEPLAQLPKDTTAPGPVTGLQLSGNSINSISLSWINPTDADLAHVLIRRAAGATAPSAGQGTLVATLATTKTTFTDTGLSAASTYSYAAFATDKAGNQSPAAAITVSTAATDARTGLRGALSDAQGHGIGNVLVHVRLGTIDVAGATTSSTGAYSVTNLAAGSYAVCYEPKSNVGGRSLTGYLASCYHQQPYGSYGQPTPTPVTVTAGALTSRVDDTLAVSGAISGRITGPDGSPVAGVVITTTSYFPQQYYTAVSAADGSYLMKNLPTNYGYSFCYATAQATGSSTAGYLSSCDYNALYVRAGEVTTANHTLDVGGIVTGVVRDLAGNPVAGVSVQNFSLGGNPAVTDATGRYRVTGLYSGSYYFCADGSSVPSSTTAPYGYLDGCGYLPSMQVDVRVNQTVTQDFTLTRYGALGGVLSQSDGTPAAGASVYVFTSDGYGSGFEQTDAQGHWQERLVPNRQYYACYILYDSTNVWTCHQGQGWNGGQPTGDLISVSEGALTPVNDTLLAGASLSGTVIDSDGAAFPNAVVSVGEEDGYQSVQAFTDSAGHYSVTGLPAGKYLVCFSADRPPASPGYPYQCLGESSDPGYPYVVTLATGQRAVVDFTLAVGTAITGRVTDADGNPVGGVAVRLTDLGDGAGSSTGYTDGDGNYSFYQLFPGDYSVCFDPQNTYPQPATGYLATCWHDQSPPSTGDPVHAVAGVISSGIDATLTAGGRITGVVTDPAGNLLGGIFVHALSADGTVIADGYTDWQDGSYQLSALPAVPVAVCFDPSWQPYQPVCYAHAADYHTATMITAASGMTVSGIDAQLSDSTAALNRAALSPATKQQA